MVKRGCTGKVAKKPACGGQKARRKKAVAEKRRRRVKKVVTAVNALAKVPGRRGRARKITIKEIVGKLGGSAAVSGKTVGRIRKAAGLENVHRATPRYPDIPVSAPSSSQRSGGWFCH